MLLPYRPFGRDHFSSTGNNSIIVQRIDVWNGTAWAADTGGVKDPGGVSMGF